MSAKEMFEEMGYTFTQNEEGIAYLLGDKVGVQFRDAHKDVVFGMGISITADLLKAVTKQYEELGWL